MASTTMVHVRVDEKVKAEAAATLAKMGLSMSDAIRMMLVRVAAEKAERYHGESYAVAGKEAGQAFRFR